MDGIESFKINGAQKVKSINYKNTRHIFFKSNKKYWRRVLIIIIIIIITIIHLFYFKCASC
jgi:hypothetical protein